MGRGVGVWHCAVTGHFGVGRAACVGWFDRELGQDARGGDFRGGPGLEARG